MTDIPTNHNGRSNRQTDRFTDSSINRRTFLRLSAATGTALALPGNASASVSSEKMETEYEYVLNHTSADYAVPTLVTFTDETGPEDLKSVIEEEVITTTEPQPAAYTQLTTTEAQTAADLPTAETLSHSPGSNPFWRLGYYPFGVFPEPRRSTGFIDYEQMIDGLNHLESQHSDRLNVYSIGKSPGHYNYLTDREDPKDLYVAEVTNDIADEATFRKKTKIMYSLSMHGLERAGAEAGSRFIEGLLRGNESDAAQLLDDLVLVFVYPNPDGWVAKHPQYESGWQVAGPEGGAPVAPFYERGNAEVFDTNRQYPTVGWIDPAEFPGEPKGANLIDDEPGVDDDVPDTIRHHVPDTLSIVEHFRNYENLEYGADLHGALWLSEFVLGLISQHQFSTDEFHQLYQLNQEVDKTLEAALEKWTTAGDAREALLDDRNVKVLYETLPEESFDYSGIWDTIGYTDAGFFGDWMAHPEELGGLGLTSMDFEMAYSHMVGANVYNPELVEMQVTGYRTAIRTIAEYATKDVNATIDTGGDSIAYVTTDSLIRSSDDLSFSSTETTTATDSLTLDAGVTKVATHTVDSNVSTLAVQIHPRPDTLVSVALRNPSGETVQRFDPSELIRYDGVPPIAVNDPAIGKWTIEVTNLLEEDGAVDVAFGTLSSDGTHPNPEEVLGYSQREYEVNPLVFFEDYGVDATGAIDLLSVAEVKAGEHENYDHLVVIHDDAISDADYVAALDHYVDNGGNLVLTDSGVNILGPMSNDLASGIEDKHIENREDLYLGYIGTFPPDVAVTGGDNENKNTNHPLLEDTRDIQKQLYKIVPLGYNVGYEAPMSLIDPDAFANVNDEQTVATIAGRTSGADDWVGVGSLTHRGESPADDPGDGIHVIGGLLPPASQEHLHPFGLLDYTVSFFGQTVLTNALDAKQVRTVDGEIVQTFGEIDNFAVDEPPIPFSVSGSREDDGSTFTARQTNQVVITVTPSDASAVRDTVPSEWNVLSKYSDDVERVEKANGVKHVYFSAEASADKQTSYTYFIEAPDSTGSYEFGPVEVHPSIRDKWIEVDGTTETNYVAGAKTDT